MIVANTLCDVYHKPSSHLKLANHSGDYDNTLQNL